MERVQQRYGGAVGGCSWYNLAWREAIIDIVAPAAQKEILVGKVKAELFEGRGVKLREGKREMRMEERPLKPEPTDFS